MSALLEYLQKKKDDRGIMADLRCALVESKKHRAYPHLGRFRAIGDEHKQKVQQIVAGLFATHPLMKDDGDTGGLCRKLTRADEDMEKGPMAKRLQYLLAANNDEILERIKTVILRAKAEGLPINFNGLENDLTFWGENVKTRWAQSFWAPNVEESDEIPDQN